MMDNFTDFPVLKAVGDKGEAMFHEFLLKKKFINIEPIDEVYQKEEILQSAWDFRAVSPLGIKCTFKVKSAFECDAHQYFNVETLQNGEPGGLTVSLADYFVMVNTKLGFGIVKRTELLKIHEELEPQINPEDYANRRWIGEYRLWKTDKDNPACGWRQKNDTIKWHKLEDV